MNKNEQKIQKNNNLFDLILSWCNFVSFLVQIFEFGRRKTFFTYGYMAFLLFFGENLLIYHRYYQSLLSSCHNNFSFWKKSLQNL